jgi:hypothetical protein
MTKTTLDQRLAELEKKLRGAGRRFARADKAITDICGEDGPPIEADWDRDDDTEVTAPVYRHQKAAL